MPDVNVLVYAHREEAPHHAGYLQVLQRLAESPEPFALSELVLSGFLRVVTQGALRPPTPLAVALEFVDSLRDAPNARLVLPGPEHWRIFAQLVKATGATGRLVADAYHAALAIEHGCEWLTADADFMRFPGLRVRHPLQPPPP